MLEKLAESRRAQRQLVADASHELRTPLATVQANVELLSRAGELPPQERVELREDLLSQLRELTRLVGDLVELARERPPESDLEELDLAELVAGCVERARGARLLRVRPPARRWCAPTAPGSTARSPTCSTTRASGARPAAPCTSRWPTAS